MKLTKEQRAELDAAHRLRLLRSWPEDFAHENGEYLCRCHRCQRDFIGYKRRVTCRICEHETATAGRQALKEGK